MAAAERPGRADGRPDDPPTYQSVQREAEAELIVKKSRFIGCVAPVASEEEARAFIARISSRHAEATHNVWAYRLGYSGERARCDDDGEPSGTAGRPALEVVERRGLTQVALVVTRYFGGVLLGAAGLVRAYAQTAAAAIDAGRPVEWRLHARWRAVVPYSSSGRIPHLIDELGGSVEQAAYTELVSYTVSIETGGETRLTDAVRDATGGRAEMTRLPSEYRPVSHDSGPR